MPGWAWALCGAGTMLFTYVLVAFGGIMGLAAMLSSVEQTQEVDAE